MFCQLILRPLPPPSPYLWIPVSPTPNLTTAQSAEVRVWAAQKFDSDLGFIWGDFFLRDLWGLWALRRHFYLQIKGDWGLAIWSGGPAKVDQFSFSSLDPTNKFTVLFCFVLCWPFSFAIVDVDVDDDYVTDDYYDEDEWWCAMTTSMGSNVDHVWTLFCAPLNRRTQCTWMINTSRDSTYIWQFLHIKKTNIVITNGLLVIISLKACKKNHPEEKLYGRRECKLLRNCEELQCHQKFWTFWKFKKISWIQTHNCTTGQTKHATIWTEQRKDHFLLFKLEI